MLSKKTAVESGGREAGAYLGHRMMEVALKLWGGKKGETWRDDSAGLEPGPQPPT